jgi:hypothetical protein
MFTDTQSWILTISVLIIAAIAVITFAAGLRR